MQYNIYNVHPLLAPYIEAYWVVLGQVPDLATVERPPSGSVNLVFNLGETTHSNLESGTMEHEGLYLVGSNDRMVENYALGFIQLYGVRFKPGAFHYFFKWGSLHERVNRVEPFDRSQFPNRKLFDAFSIPELDRFFLQRLDSYQSSVRPILQDIEMRKGIVNIEELGKSHCISLKQMERNFKQQVGMGPKSYARMVRFNCSMLALKQQASNKSLLDIAYESGYYDQAHLSNEVKKYTGSNPSSLDLSKFSKECW